MKNVFAVWVVFQISHTSVYLVLKTFKLSYSCVLIIYIVELSFLTVANIYTETLLCLYNNMFTKVVRQSYHGSKLRVSVFQYYVRYYSL